MHIPRYVAEMMKRLYEEGHTAYVVGGCVRDYFLGRVPQDYDLATSATPEEVQNIFSKTVPTGFKHGTVTVLASEGVCEVTTYRSGQTIEGDLAHRDFTINAIAYDGQMYVDPFRGRADLRRKIIRAVGQPKDRFQEDPLRMFRAVRFAAQLDFSVEEETKKGIQELSGLLQMLPAERMRDEWVKLLLSNHVGYGFKLLQELNLLNKVWLDIEISTRIVGNVSSSVEEQPDSCSPQKWANKIYLLEHAPRNLVIRLAILLTDSNDNYICQSDYASQFLKRLKFPGQLINQVSTLLRECLPGGDAGWSSSTMKKWINRVGVDLVELFFQYQLALLSSAENVLERERLLRFRKLVRGMIEKGVPLTKADMAISGRDLIEIGIQEGQEIGRILTALLERVLEDESLNELETLLHLAKRLAEENQ